MTLRDAALALVLLTLSACVTFERAPVATLDCDPALAGQWRPLKGGPQGRDIVVSADCTVQWPEENGGTYTTTLAGFALGASRYLVFTPAVADRLMSADGDMLRKAPKDSVFLVRYSLHDDRATVWLADEDEAMRPPVKDAAADQAKEQVSARRIDASNVHVEGSREAIAALLRARGETLFAGTPDGRGAMELQRVAAEVAP
jgi:hypothetical protein